MRKQLFINISIAVLLVIFCISATLLIIQKLDYQNNDKLYTESIQEFTDIDTEAKPKVEEPIPDSNEEIIPVLEVKIDFDALESVNKDTIGWILIPNTPINYPLVQGTDNQKYLTHAYNGSYSKLGSIFMDYRNSADFSDGNTVIYGHNTKNKSMFGSLHDFGKQEFFDQTRYIYVFARDETIIYEVFSAYITDAYSDSYQFRFAEEESFSNYLMKVESQSIFKTAIELNNEDEIITLSTCTSSGNQSERFLIHGRRITL